MLTVDLSYVGLFSKTGSVHLCTVQNEMSICLIFGKSKTEKSSGLVQE